MHSKWLLFLKDHSGKFLNQNINFVNLTFCPIPLKYEESKVFLHGDKAPFSGRDRQRTGPTAGAVAQAWTAWATTVLRLHVDGAGAVCLSL